LYLNAVVRHLYREYAEKKMIEEPSEVRDHFLKIEDTTYVDDVVIPGKSKGEVITYTRHVIAALEDGRMPVVKFKGSSADLVGEFSPVQGEKTEPYKILRVEISPYN